MQREHPDADGVLPLVIYSDETHVSKSRNVHVLLVFIALPLHIMRADGGLFRYLAFPPSFRGRDIGLPKKAQKKRCPNFFWPLTAVTPHMTCFATCFNHKRPACLAYQPFPESKPVQLHCVDAFADFNFSRER